MKFEKTFLASFAFFAALGMAFAQDLTINPVAPWHTLNANGQKIYSIDYSGLGWAGIDVKAAVRTDTYYKLSWRMKGSVEDPEAFFGLEIKMNGKNGYQSYVLTGDWSEYDAYFHTGPASSVNLRLYTNPSPAKNIQINDIRLVEQNPSDFGRNILPDGEFEDSVGIPANWHKSWGADVNSAKIVHSQDFISGEHSLEVEFPMQAKGHPGIQSILMPVTPGKENELKFWAKAPSEYTISVSIDSWVLLGQHKDAHFWKGQSFKISQNWKEYSFKVEIPSDISKYPDLEQRMVRVLIQGEKDHAGKVCLDGMIFHELTEPATK